MGDFENNRHSGLDGNSEHREENHKTSVFEPRRLRDREALKRKREEVQNEDPFQQGYGKRQTRAKGPGRGRRKQVQQPEPGPLSQPEHSLEPKHEPEVEVEHVPEPELQHEPEYEQTSELVSDAPQEQEQYGQEPLEHHDPPSTVTDDDAANVTMLIHEEANGHLPEETHVLTGKEVPEPVSAAPEVLSFSHHPEEEHQYYTPLL